MPIEGPLRELGIYDVFQLLDLSRKTGVLRVSSELRDDEGMVYFESGRVVHATIRSRPLLDESRDPARLSQRELDRRDDERRGGGRHRRLLRNASVELADADDRELLFVLLDGGDCEFGGLAVIHRLPLFVDEGVLGVIAEQLQRLARFLHGLLEAIDQRRRAPVVLVGEMRL